MHHRFSDSDRWKHRAFWQASDRIVKLRIATAEICEELGTTDADLRFRIDLILGGADTPTPKTIGRVFDGADLNNKPWAVTAICWAMDQLCDERSARLEGKPQTVAEIRQLLAQAKVEFAGFPPPADTGGSRGPIINRSYLQVAVNAIKGPMGEDDPQFPEFPPQSPRYPATPFVSLDLGPCEVLLKDESYNPTGSHKDRWAWEQLLIYKRILQLTLKRDVRSSQIDVPSLAIISAGSAAYALQCLLRLYGLPPLHVIIDEERVGIQVTDLLRQVGAIVHPCDLDQMFLDEDAVRSATGLGKNCIDITTRKIATPRGERFYDWLVCEILREKPTHIFLPFGTGDLYTNVICFIEREIEAKSRDLRITSVDAKDLRNIHVVGATTHNKQTRMNKLYAQFRSTWDEIQAKVIDLKGAQVIGNYSEVMEVTDECAERAKDYVARFNVKTELSGIAALGLFMEKMDNIDLKDTDKVVVVNTGWLFTGH
jgi:cysteine synthase